MSQTKKKIINGSLVDILGTIINAILSFVILRYYFHLISKEDYGIWLAIFGVASLIGLVDIGVDQYFLTIIPNDTKFFDKSFANDLTNFFVLKFFIIIIFFIIGSLIYIFLNSILTISPVYIKVSKIVFLLTVFLLLFNIFSSTLTTILNGRSHFAFINIITNLGLFISNALTLILLYFNIGLISFPIALLIVAIIQFLIFFLYIKKKYPHLRFGRLDLRGKSEMFRYSFSFQILKWAFIIRNQSLVILLNNIVGPAGVTLFNITNRIPQMIPTYMNKIIAPLFPSYATMIYNNETDKIKNVVLKVIKILGRFSVFLTFGIILFNKIFVTLWVGSDKFAGHNVNSIIALYVLIMSVCSGFGMIIFSTKKFQYWPVLSIVEIILTLLLSYYFGKMYGIIGVFSGFLFGSIITQFYITVISLKQIKLSIREIYNKCFKYIIYPNLFSILIGIVIYFTSNINTWSSLFLSVIIYSISHFLLIEFRRFISSKDTGIIQRLMYALDI